MDFNFFDKFTHIKLGICKALCCKCKTSKKEYLTKSQLLYMKGYKKIMRRDLNIEYLLKSIKKLKAGLAAVIADDPHLIRKAKQMYFTNQTVYSSSDEGKKIRASNPFY